MQAVSGDYSYEFLHSAEAFQMSNSEFKSKYGMNKPDKDADDIIFHCKAGGRSTFALRIAQTLGYSK